MSGVPNPSRGDVWLADLDPVFGHEQGGRRPVLVLSSDPFNSGRAGLVVVLPITTKTRALPLHILVQPPEGGLRLPSAILCDAIRSIAGIIPDEDLSEDYVVPSVFDRKVVRAVAKAAAESGVARRPGRETA